MLTRGEIETLTHCWWERRCFGNSLAILQKVKQSYHISQQSPDRHIPKRNEDMSMYKLVHTFHSIIIAKKWKSLDVQLMNGWIETCCIHAVGDVGRVCSTARTFMERLYHIPALRSGMYEISIALLSPQYLVVLGFCLELPSLIGAKRHFTVVFISIFLSVFS